MGLPSSSQTKEWSCFQPWQGSTGRQLAHRRSGSRANSGGKILMATSRPELAIVRAIDLAHAAGTQQRHDPIGSELPAQQSADGRLRTVMSRMAGVSRKLPASSHFASSRFDLQPQAGVSAACNVEERLPRFWSTLQSRVEEFLNSPPTLLVHGNAVLAVSQCYCIAGDGEWRSLTGLLCFRKATRYL